MTRNTEIADCFKRMGTEMATNWSAFSLIKRWASNSQYGYVMSWHETKRSARCATLSYYRARMNLIRQ